MLITSILLRLPVRFIYFFYYVAYICINYYLFLFKFCSTTPTLSNSYSCRYEHLLSDSHWSTMRHKVPVKMLRDTVSTFHATNEELRNGKHKDEAYLSSSEHSCKVGTAAIRYWLMQIILGYRKKYRWFVKCL